MPSYSFIENYSNNQLPNNPIQTSDSSCDQLATKIKDLNIDDSYINDIISNIDDNQFIMVDEPNNYIEDLYYNKYKNIKLLSLNKKVIVILLILLKLIVISLILGGCFIFRKNQPAFMILLLFILIINEFNDDECILTKYIDNLLETNTSIIKNSTYKLLIIVIIIISLVSYIFPSLSLTNLLNNKISDKNLDNKIFPDIKPDKFKIEVSNQDAIKNLSILDMEYE